MSSPIVECVRDIPLIVERDYPMEDDNSGFPFDDDRDESNSTFRSQLDDIAARHPEFAHHLGTFPFRSSGRARTQIPEEFAQHYTDRPFGDRFERFGFPFDETLSEEEHKPYYQRYPHYYPQDHQENQEESSTSGQEPQSSNSEVNEESVDQEDSGRGRKLKNIQQSNTVDLGQRQEPVNDRNQRSMSAPPPNNRQRFVSSINIPVNQPKEGQNTAPNMPQTSTPPQPQERVIPIHVEGRDEPILPKKFAPTNSQPHVHQQQSQPHTDKFFTQKPPNFPQYFNRDQNLYKDWFPKNFQNKQPQPQPSFSQNQRGRSPQPHPKPETPQQQPPKPEAPQQPTNIPEQAESQKKHMSSKPDPIDQIKSIQKDVSELMAEVDKFAGQPKDKKYLYLDEMLTRNLIKLDNIDTQGQENIRSARKEAIKCIEKCISILESKANSNLKNSDVGESTSKEMQVEQTEGKQETAESESVNIENVPENAERKEETLETTESNNTGEQMEVETGKVDEPTENQDIGSQQVEGSTGVPEEKMETSEVHAETPESSEKSSEQKEDKDSNIEQEKESEPPKTEDKSEVDKEKKKSKKKA